MTHPNLHKANLEAGFPMSYANVEALTAAFENVDVNFPALILCISSFAASGKSFQDIIDFAVCLAAAISAP